MLRKATLPIVAVLALLLGLAGPAHASVTDKILRDCADDGILQGLSRYTSAELRAARKEVKGDLAEYSDCADIIARAADRLVPSGGGGAGGSGSSGGAPGASGGTGGIGGGGSQAPLTPSTAQDNAALQAAGKAPTQPVTVAGSKLLAGAAPLRRGYRANGLPDSLIVALVLLAAAGVALSFPPVRRRLLTLRRRP